MKILQKIPVKQILTEKSKKKLAEQFMSRKKQLEQECQQLLFEERKLLNKKGVSKLEVNKRFRQEIDNREIKIKNMEFQMEQLNILPLGSEITEGEVETLVEVKVGDDWEELVSNRAILIEDGIVIQIK